MNKGINLQLFATPQPQEEAEREERDKQLAAMQRELTIMKSTNTYMDVLEMSKETAQRYAEARADGDGDKENEILRQHMKSFRANVLQSFLKSRGEINAGHGNAETESKATRFIKSLPIYSDQVDEELIKKYM